mmetsp:Transcript_17302/g.35425  ORF Transcript_17302/g.35425 Transcript_17302/m.35425 type:complete len:512 (-) Transcript_17302:283-1818(-)
MCSRQFSLTAGPGQSHHAARGGRELDGAHLRHNAQPLALVDVLRGGVQVRVDKLYHVRRHLVPGRQQPQPLRARGLHGGAEGDDGLHAGGAGREVVRVAEPGVRAPQLEPAGAILLGYVEQRVARRHAHLALSHHKLGAPPHRPNMGRQPVIDHVQAQDQALPLRALLRLPRDRVLRHVVQPVRLRAPQPGLALRQPGGRHLEARDSERVCAGPHAGEGRELEARRGREVRAEAHCWDVDVGLEPRGVRCLRDAAVQVLALEHRQREALLAPHPRRDRRGRRLGAKRQRGRLLGCERGAEEVEGGGDDVEEHADAGGRVHAARRGGRGHCVNADAVSEVLLGPGGEGEAAAEEVLECRLGRLRPEIHRHQVRVHRREQLVARPAHRFSHRGSVGQTRVCKERNGNVAAACAFLRAVMVGVVEVDVSFEVLADSHGAAEPHCTLGTVVDEDRLAVRMLGTLQRLIRTSRVESWPAQDEHAIAAPVPPFCRIFTSILCFDADFSERVWDHGKV